MGRKREDGTLQDDCLDKIKPGEPFFVLRGQDRIAPFLVRAWASLAQSEYGMSLAKYHEAMDCAIAMERWQPRKFPD